MSEGMIDLSIIAMGILCNVSCALVGCYLILRRLSLLGDAISHAVLLGLVVAFILVKQKTSLPMLAGAMAVGVLTAFLVQTVHRFARVTQDTSIGVVFTTLFALGVVLIKVYPGTENVHFDAHCVFEGEIETQIMDDPVSLAGLSVPPATLYLAGMLVGNLVFITLLWKELKLATFDPALSSSLGFSAGLLFYLLMAMVAATTVVSFWVVGSILVVAMLIVPGATAQLLTDRFGVLLLLAALVATISAVAGYFLADRWEVPTSGMMAVVAGAQYVLAMFLAPRHGLLVRWARNLAMALRITAEDILAYAYRWEERHPGEPMPVGEATRVAGSERRRLAIWLLKWRRRITEQSGLLRLTEAGRSLAAGLVRSHRLWESYLARHAELPADHLHAPAMRMEHYVTREIEHEIEKDLETELADATTDPHGQPIPAPDRRAPPASHRGSATGEEGEDR